MPATPPRPVSPKHVAIDAALCLVAFVAFFNVVRIHVPSSDPLYVAAGSAFTASCMTGVFWIAMQMFKAVARHQREGRSSDE